MLYKIVCTLLCRYLSHEIQSVRIITKMKFKIKILWTTLLTTQLWPLIVLGIEVHEPHPENITDNEEFPLLATTEAVTVQPSDNGMVVGEIPEEVTASTFLNTYEDKEEPEFPTPTVPTVAYTFPENHKNFTGSPYLGAIETPPVVESFNKYQQQYKEYYDQKNQYQQYAHKPVKFEENSHKNRYVSEGLANYYEHDPVPPAKPVELHYRHRPFPYAFEQGIHASNNYDPQVTENDPGTGSGNVVSFASQEYHGQDHNEVETPSIEELSTHFKAPPLAYKHYEPTFGIFGGGGGGGVVEQHHGEHQGGEHHGQHHHEVQKNGGTWKKVLRMLSALVPLGLFIATLTPTVLSINTTVDQKPSRQRSLEDIGIKLNETDLRDPLVQLIQKYGLDSLDDPQCEDKIFCEMARMGEQDSGNFIQRGFWYLANETPDDLAQQAGMKELFRSIRTNTCDMYKCEPKKKSEEKSLKNTKVETKIKRRKKVDKEARKVVHEKS